MRKDYLENSFDRRVYELVNYMIFDLWIGIIFDCISKPEENKIQEVKD